MPGDKAASLVKNKVHTGRCQCELTMEATARSSMGTCNHP
jgi:hypothetical protein